MISGLLAAAMFLSVAAMPVSSMAEEHPPAEDIDAYVASLPELDKVMDQLDKDEVVTAKDLEVEYASKIDLTKDLKPDQPEPPKEQKAPQASATPAPPETQTPKPPSADEH